MHRDVVANSFGEDELTLALILPTNSSTPGRRDRTTEMDELGASAEAHRDGAPILLDLV
jgi:hypothetical protein